MAISLDDPKKLRTLRDQAHQVAMNMLRPISRKYDLAEHEYPKELDMLAAMIDGLAESEPVPGSVIAIDAQRPSKRSCCSSSATDAIAELPSPWRGIDSRRPTSPQHISATDITEARLAPFLTPVSSAPDSSRRTPAAPAPSFAPDSESPSIIAASMSSSLGYACSARS